MPRTAHASRPVSAPSRSAPRAWHAPHTSIPACPTVVRSHAPARRQDAPAPRASPREKETSAARGNVWHLVPPPPPVHGQSANLIHPATFPLEDHSRLWRHLPSATTRQFVRQN